VANLKLVNPPGSGPIIRNDQGAGAGAARDFIGFEAASSEVFSVDANGLPDPGGGDATRDVTVCIGDIVADSDALDMCLARFNVAVTITAIYYCVDTATADGTTNRQTLLVSESGGDLQVASVDTPTANPSVAQATWTSMGAITNGAMSAGEYLYLSPTKIASGIAMSNLTFRIEYTMTA
jgi:hypothetical protein